MWPNFNGITPANVSSSGAKLQSEKISSVVPLGSLNSHGLANAGCDVAAPLALDAGFFQPRNDFAGIAVRCDLKREPRRCHGAVALEHDRLKACFSGEDRAIFFTRDKA